MSDIPEADAQEQQRRVAADDEDAARRRPVDASEADVQEQGEDVRGVGRARPTRSAEVPEADAYEQSLEVDEDEDEVD